MLRGAKRFTILFIPEGHGRTVSISLNAHTVRSMAALLVLFAIGAGFLVFRGGAIALKLQAARHLSEENQRLRAEQRRLDDIRSKVRRIEEMDAYLEQLALQTGPAPLRPAPPPELPPAAQTGPAEGDSGTEVAGENAATQSGVPQGQQRYSEQILRGIPFIRPVRGWVTREYVERASDPTGLHRGIDFAAAEGTIIRATAPGEVEEVSTDEYLGKTLSLRHGSGFVTRYGHCSQILVKKGDHVERGQTIALVGNTGRSSAPHLHYEVIRNGEQVNPQRYLID
jgi:murein DD-endopeptidase MepM/ murein hydrolase activator NlpD